MLSIKFLPLNALSSDQAKHPILALKRSIIQGNESRCRNIRISDTPAWEEYWGSAHFILTITCSSFYSASCGKLAFKCPTSVLDCRMAISRSVPLNSAAKREIHSCSSLKFDDSSR